MSDEKESEGPTSEERRAFLDTDARDRVRRVSEMQSQPGYRPPGPGDTTKMRRAAEAITAQVTTTRLRQLGGIISGIVGALVAAVIWHGGQMDSLRTEERDACADQVASEQEDTASANARLDRCEERLDNCRDQ